MKRYKAELCACLTKVSCKTNTFAVRMNVRQPVWSDCLPKRTVCKFHRMDDRKSRLGHSRLSVPFRPKFYGPHATMKGSFCCCGPRSGKPLQITRLHHSRDPGHRGYRVRGHGHALKKPWLCLWRPFCGGIRCHAGPTGPSPRCNRNPGSRFF